MALTGTETAGGVTGLPQALLDVYSAEIQHKALPTMKFEQFAVVKTELTTTPGTTIIFTTYQNLDVVGPLTEGVDMEEDSLSATQLQISVVEYGKAIKVTEKLLLTSYDDVLGEAAILLSRNYAKRTDLMLRDTALAASNVVGSAGNWPLNQISAPFRINDVRNGVEVLNTNDAPKFDAAGGDSFFVCFCHPHQATSLKKDPEWVSAQSYAGAQNLFTGEIGKFDDVRFISTTHMNNGAVAASDDAYDATLDGTGASGANLYKASLMADNSFGWAIGLPVEMRDDGVKNYGRKHGLAWYSLMGSGILNDENLVTIVTQ